MRIRRLNSGITFKAALLAMVAAASVFASLNATPDSFRSGIPSLTDAYQYLTDDNTSRSLSKTSGTQVFEHAFADEYYDDHEEVEVEGGDEGTSGGVAAWTGKQAAAQDEEEEDAFPEEDYPDEREGEEPFDDAFDEDALELEQREQEEEEEWEQEQEQQQQQEEELEEEEEGVETEEERLEQEESAAAVAQRRGDARRREGEAGAAAGGAVGRTPSPDQQYHVVVSVDDALYTQWQVRVCYYWYKEMKKKYPGSAMGGFTRLLHSGVADGYMDEIPTVVVDPLPDKWQQVANGYVVLNRPYAFLQWVRDHMASIPEQYVLMSEPDHLILRPPPLWATPTKPAAFPFFYIEPEVKENADIIKRLSTKKVPISKFAPIGNSPVMISKTQLGPIIELWSNLSLVVKQDEEADRVWGWVQEMYAFSLASALALKKPVEFSLYPEFMLQPPWDADLVSADNGKPAYIIHYTYGNDFNPKGDFTPGKVGEWHWDKRDYMDKYPPPNFPMPPEGCTNEAVKYLVAAVNEAAEHLPGWKEKAFTDVSEVKVFWNEEPEGEEGEQEKEGEKEEEAEE